jgi:high affinity cGMP-specific 3',5'-cyclic phosphodiesterase 9
MSHHSKILHEFKGYLGDFNYEVKEQRTVVRGIVKKKIQFWFNVFFYIKKLMKILMKTADISNECRPLHVSETWLECLLTEFFNQVIKVV